ncbi:MAG TPA: hypothetical protein VHE61_05235 [Opitutaceae bacterium]|nr:hypothetical protein [Opitutaceae bacterium]
MSPEFLAHLCSRGAAIQDRWRRLLHVEPVAGPLANPEALEHLIPLALAQILDFCGNRTRRSPSLQKARIELPGCECGHNPYRAFFAAAEQALTEEAVLVQAAQAPAARAPNDLAALIYAIRVIAGMEIDTFCSVCTHQGTARRCRFTGAKSAAG